MMLLLHCVLMVAHTRGEIPHTHTRGEIPHTHTQTGIQTKYPVSSQAGKMEIEESKRRTSLQSILPRSDVDLGAVYAFFVTPENIFNFMLIYPVQLIANTVAWYILHILWTSYRGFTPPAQEVSLEGVIKFLFDPTSSAINVAISVGYFIMNLVSWSLLGVIGYFYLPRDETPAVTTSGDILTYLDNKLSPQGILIQTIINIILSIGFIGFWVIMSWFPQRLRRKLGFGTEDPLDLSLDLLNQSLLYFENL